MRPVAAALGSAAGLALGFWLFPKVVAAVYAIMYTLPSLTTPFHGALAAESTLVVLACVVGGNMGGLQHRAACGACRPYEAQGAFDRQAGTHGEDDRSMAADEL